MAQLNDAEPDQICNQESHSSVAEDKKETLDTEIQNMKNSLQRAQADLVNYRNRSEGERKNLLRYANSRLLIKLLPVLDEFKLAMDQAPDSESGEPWLEGFKLIQRKLHSLMESEGVTQIEAEDQVFDPSKHEALAQQESSEHNDDHIIQVVRDGYILDDRILRPAQVIVAKTNNSTDSI